MAGRFSVEAIFKAVDRVTAPVSRMQNSVGKFTRSMERNFRAANQAIDKTASGIKSFGGAVATYGAVGIGALTTGVTLLVREFSKIENAEAAFTPLMGGAARAKDLVEALNKAAASTPFQFETLAGATNQLLPTMDRDIERTIKTLKMLGDTAGGNAQKLESITRGFSKAMLLGKVDLDSLNMIAEAGVPIYNELAASMGKKVGPAFSKMISDGRITTQDLTKAFERMTSEGGLFYRGMEIASLTTTGLWSTLADEVSQTAAQLGAVLAPTIKDIINQTTVLVQQLGKWVSTNREVIDQKFLQFVDAVKNGFVSLTNAVSYLQDNAETIKRVTLSVGALIVGIKAMTAALAIANMVMLANPVGLVVAGFIALGAVITSAAVWWEDIERAIVGAAVKVVAAWLTVKEFFADLWPSIIDGAKAAFNSIPIIKFGRLLGTGAGMAVEQGSKVFNNIFGDDETEGQSKPAPMTSSPMLRAVESRTTESAEVTIRDETNRAAVTRGKLANNIQLQQSGVF